MRRFSADSLPLFATASNSPWPPQQNPPFAPPRCGRKRLFRYHPAQQIDSLVSLDHFTVPITTCSPWINDAAHQVQLTRPNTSRIPSTCFAEKIMRNIWRDKRLPPSSTAACVLATEEMILLAIGLTLTISLQPAEARENHHSRPQSSDLKVGTMQQAIVALSGAHSEDL